MKLKFTRYDILVFASLTILLYYIVSSYYFIRDTGANQCLMTYMYEYPQFVKINMSNQLEKVYHRYVLYAYSEGKYIERTRAMKFTGIPILFVPGHGGSFKQVRSLASVTTHRTLDLQSIFHFDFFTIDFNGELSALYGGTLRDQHEFIISCVDKVLKLYPPQNRPKSVIIIGHSMGGMIARSLFMNLSFDPSTVKLILTLATPHQPVILIDKDLKEFYESVDTFWNSEKSRSSNRLENLTLISIGGGAKDVLVRPGLTYNNLADLNVLTNAIPNVITSTDHLCIVWCNNFIKTVSRALYDAVDFDIKGITEDRKHLRNIFYYHLVHCSNGKYFTSEIHREKIKFTKNSTWKKLTKNYTSTIYESGLDQDAHVLIEKPIDLSKFDTIMIEAINIDKRDWIAECNVQPDYKSTSCEEGENLSQHGSIGFIKVFRRKYFRVSFNSSGVFRKYLQHLVVRLPSTGEETGLNMDMYKRESRVISIDLDFLLYCRRTIIERTHPRALFYTIRLNNMVTMWKVYHLYLIPSYCARKKHAAFAVFKTPWNYDGSNVKVTWKEEQVLKLILLTIPPAEIKDVPSVDLILDPACSYSVHIEAAYSDSLATIATRYSFTLVANLAALLLLTLVSQYSYLANQRWCPSFLDTLKRGKGAYFVYPIVKLVTFIWKLMKLDEILFKLDTQLLAEDTADDIVVPIIMYVISFALLYVIGSCLHYTVLFNVHVYEKYSIGDLLTRIRLTQDPFVADSVRKVLPASLAATVLSVSCLTCSGHGFIAGTVFYYTSICYTYKKCVEYEQSYLEDEREDNLAEENAVRSHLVPKMSSVHLHSTLFLLWALCAVTYLPSSIMWHKNMKLGLMQDGSFGFSLMYSCATGFLWHCNIPYIFTPHYRSVSYLHFLLACVTLLTCQVNIFRIPALLTSVLSLVALHQCYGLILRKQRAFEVNGDKKME